MTEITMETANASFITSIEMDDRTRERQELIVGPPPRIAPLAVSEFTEEAQIMNHEIRVAFDLPLDLPPWEYLATILRHPSLFRRHNATAVELISNGALTPRDRELAILRLSWLLQAPYEFGEHVGTAKRMVGFTGEEIEQVIIGSAAPGWSEHERAIIRAVEELLEDAMISDETWAVLAKSWNDKQLLELPVLIGQYQGVAYLQNSIRTRLMDGNPGLSAR
jgi:alkylhydroperoxidase family enzyme